MKSILKRLFYNNSIYLVFIFFKPYYALTKVFKSSWDVFWNGTWNDGEDPWAATCYIPEGNYLICPGPGVDTKKKIDRNPRFGFRPDMVNF